MVATASTLPKPCLWHPLRPMQVHLYNPPPRKRTETIRSHWPHMQLRQRDPESSGKLSLLLTKYRRTLRQAQQVFLSATSFSSLAPCQFELLGRKCCCHTAQNRLDAMDHSISKRNSPGVVGHGEIVLECSLTSVLFILLCFPTYRCRNTWLLV
jgi:hypothetical protein